MEELNRQVRRARQRMGLQRFAGVLGWCWFATLLAALVLIAVGRFYPIGVQDRVWLAGALGLGLVAAMVWLAVTRRKPIEAAIEIDRRYQLKERVSSTLAMDPEERGTPLGQALLDDAVRRVERIDVSEHFSVVPRKSILLPLLPGAAAVLLALLLPAVVENPAEATPENAAVAKQVKRSSDALRRKLVKRRKKAEELGLKDAQRLFKKLEQGIDDMANRETKRRDAMVKLNDLARELQKRRQKLGGTDNIKKQLDRLGKIKRGPAEKFAKAISKGDFGKAADELQKIKNQLKDSDLGEEQKQALADQLDRIKNKLDKLAESHQAAVDDLKQRAKQARAAGRKGEANKLDEQLSKLMQQAPGMQQLQDMAQQLDQCSKCLKQGQMQDAADALDQLQSGLGSLQQQLDEMELLDDAMQQLSQARDQMTCPGCKGAGCAACGGKGKGEGEGVGMGEGQGKGARPEAETETKMYDSQVRQKVGKGIGVITGTADGPNVRGNAEDAIQQQIDSARRGSTDPLSGRRMPRKYREHAEEYMNRWQDEE